MGHFAICLDTSATLINNFGTIGSGQSNYVGPGTNHSSIFGGNTNIVNGNCSAILGGFGNNDNGVPLTGMFGNGLAGSPLVLYM
jgi:hypothetical protein